MANIKVAGKAVIAMIKKGKEAAKQEFKKELEAQLKEQPVKTTTVQHTAVKYYDDHTQKMEEDKIYRIVLNNGKIGMAVAGTISSINAFDFTTMELSRTSIGGNFYNRPEDGTLEEAVQKYNESVISEGIKIKHIQPVIKG